MSSTTLTVRMPVELKARLATLAEHTQRTNSYLAAEAIADYVARELAIVQGIEQGLEDMKAGRVVSHEEVMSEIDLIIERSAVGLKTE